jgi:mannitol/fructose-specific phosphotransferase system IIA component (Ntr-type)
MKLASILTKEKILLGMDADERWPAIQELIDHLDVRNLLGGENREDILKSLLIREEQTSTGIGSGVAIPHAFSEKLNEVIAIFGRSEKGIHFDAIDNAPVRFILLFIVPQKNYHLHLHALSAIAKMFNNCEIRQNLSEAQDTAEILEIFGSTPSRTHSNHSSQRLR